MSNKIFNILKKSLFSGCLQRLQVHCFMFKVEHLFVLSAHALLISMIHK